MNIEKKIRNFYDTVIITNESRSVTKISIVSQLISKPLFPYAAAVSVAICSAIVIPSLFGKKKAALVPKQ
jgi:hypothetical protein